MHKVYINNKPLIFENIYSRQPGEYNQLEILSDTDYDVKQIFNRMKNSVSGILYLCARPDQEWTAFTNMFTLIEAAGGIVSNENDELLMIYRKKKWDLPKGKLDYDESIQMAAIREVKEECGLQQVELHSEILKTFHVYTEKGKDILKKTHWFSMSTTDVNLSPQTEEEIEKAEWMTIDRIMQIVLPDTYPSIRDVINNYLRLVKLNG
jgi:8-oxo-dGTP pyrophosphatase MutT (NUDIX family)